jgi:DNA-binding MltR family transcriptional regulator
VVAPDANNARIIEESNAIEIMNSDLTAEEKEAYFTSPETLELFKIIEMKTDYGMYALFGSILPFILCAIAAIKKQKIAYLGLVFSLAAFFIGAAYGSHMFS